VETAPSDSRTKIFFFAYAAAILLAALWLSPWLLGDRNRIVNDNDSLYHLKQITSSIQHFPWIETFDPYSHFPDGNQVHWPPAHAFFFSGAYLSISEFLPYLSAEALSSWLIVLFGIIYLCLYLGILRACHLPPAARAGLFAIIVFSFPFTFLFKYGMLDHHNLSAIAVLMVSYALWKRSKPFWFFSFFLLSALTTELLLIGSFAFLSMVFDQWFLEGKEEKASTITSVWFALPCLGVFSATILNWLLMKKNDHFLQLDWQFPSLFQVLWFGLLGITFWLIKKHVTWRRGRYQWAVGAIAGLACAGLFVFFLIGTEQFEIIFDRLLQTDRLFVFEEESLFQLPGLGFPIMGVGVALYTFFSFFRVLHMGSKVFLKKKSLGEVVFGFGCPRLYGFLFFGALFSLKEMRFFLLFSPLIAADSLLIALDLHLWLKKKNVALRHVLIFLIVSVTFVPSILSGVEYRFQDNQTQEMTEKKLRLMQWIHANTPPPQGENGSLAYGILAPWDLGHHINVIAKRPVHLDPFNHDRITSSGEFVSMNKTAISFLDQETQSDFLESLDRRQTKFVLLDYVPNMYVRFPEFMHLGRSEPITHFDPFLLEYYPIRLFLEPFSYPLSPLRLKLVSEQPTHVIFSKDASLRHAKGFKVPKLQCYERVQDYVTVQIGPSKKYRLLTLSYYVEWKQTIRQMKHKIHLMESESVCFELFAPSYDKGDGWSVLSPFLLLDPNDDILEEITLSEEELKQGIDIRIDLSSHHD